MAEDLQPARSSAFQPGGLSFDSVVELLSILDGSDLPTRITYRDGPIRLKIERGYGPHCGSQTGLVQRGEAPRVEPQPADAPTQAGRTVTAADAPTRQSSDSGLGEPVVAPVTGVFYRAPRPGAEPFVAVGDIVSADDVIGIVEVMKTMNTVRAGIAGQVIEICAEDSTLVEFHQTLVRIGPLD